MLTSSAGALGAAIYCDNAAVWLDNCTIANNVATGTDAGAVGIGSSGASPVSIDDTIIAFNDGPVVNRTDEQMPANVTLARCVVFNNIAGSHRSDAQWAIAGTDVFVDDPAFCGVASEEPYGIYAFSPAAPGLNGEAGLHFDERVGAFDVGCVPEAVVTVSEGNPIYAAGSPIVGCPAGDVDHFNIQVSFDSTVVTRPLGATELSIQPPYLAHGIVSDDTIRGTSSTGYVITLDHPNISGYGVNEEVTLCLNGYPLEQKALLTHRSPDMKGIQSCAADISCPDGKVTFEDFSWFATHFQTAGNPNAPYFEGADFVANPPGTINTADFSAFAYHSSGTGHVYPGSGPLLQTTSMEQTVSTHVALAFTEEYVTALDHRLYVDVTLEDCANLRCCLFVLRSNRGDLTLSSWEPSSWAAQSAPFAPVGTGADQALCFGVIMINDSEESTRPLGRLVFTVAGSDPVTIAEDEFVLTSGDVELLNEQPGEALAGWSEPTIRRMSGVSSRVLNQGVQQVFHDRLEQNFPNPFNPQTTLAYSLKSAGDVSLVIYDVAGRRVRELVNERRAPGAYKVVWDGRDGRGTQVASGVYFYKLVAGEFVDTKKMIMLK